MNKEIQPAFYEANVRCACGEEFVVGSTRKEIRLDICSKCHPFFTGKQKFIDTAGRVDKFFRKYGEEAQRQFTKKKPRKRLSDEEVAAQEDALLDVDVDDDADLDNEETLETAEATEEAPVAAETQDN